MNSQVIKIFEEILSKFKSGLESNPFICNNLNHFRMTNEDITLRSLALKTLNDNRPTTILFPEIYKHPSFMGSISWWAGNRDSTYINVVRPEKIKYLELLIAKLKSNLQIGDVVKKKSNKPFKNGKLTDTIVGFTTNPNHPHNTLGVILKDSNTIVCVKQLECIT